MPTIFTHALVPLAAGMALGPHRVPGSLLLAGLTAAILPDLDVLAFKLGIPYASSFGHRGFSHALFSALVLGLVASPLWRRRWLVAWLFLAGSMASHGLLDLFTNGGEGVALFWPWSDVRWFAPWRPVEVSPIGLQRFLTARGLAVLLSELRWIGLPCLGVALTAWAWRRWWGRDCARTR